MFFSLYIFDFGFCVYIYNDRTPTAAWTQAITWPSAGHS
jgi:hypothetical protein